MLHDIHIHTNLSDCAKPEATLDLYIQHAKNYNLPVIGIANHYWDEKVPGAFPWYVPQNTAHIYKIKPEIEEKSGKDVKILFGAETEIDKHGTIGISVEEAAKLDFLLVPHGHTHMTNDTIPEEEKATNEKHAAFLVKSFFNILANKPLLKYITAVAHPFTAVGTPGEEIVKIHSYISDKQFEDCFEALRDADIAAEINTAGFVNPIFRDNIAQAPYTRMYKIAKRVGCKFTLGSDAHGEKGCVPFSLVSEIMSISGITETDLVDVLSL